MQDSAGRVFMFDKAGNIYYDTEDARTGMYIVDTEGRMYNKFVDKQGQVSVTGGTRGGHLHPRRRCVHRSGCCWWRCCRMLTLTRGAAVKAAAGLRAAW